jgi:hypothetical protein
VNVRMAFLTARLDEEEAEARAAHDGLFADSDGTLHVCLYDPARVLREVELKRKILAEHAPEFWSVHQPHMLRCQQGHGDEYWTPWPCVEVCALMAVYSDHPDYHADWRSDVGIT